LRFGNLTPSALENLTKLNNDNNNNNNNNIKIIIIIIIISKYNNNNNNNNNNNRTTLQVPICLTGTGIHLYFSSLFIRLVGCELVKPNSCWPQDSTVLFLDPATIFT
jgi:hypothetical protein